MVHMNLVEASYQAILSVLIASLMNTAKCIKCFIEVFCDLNGLTIFIKKTYVWDVWD